MTPRALPRLAITAGLGFVASFITVLVLGNLGAGRPLILAAAFVGWAAALVALRPLVERDKHTGLYFAFGVMALMIFFIHQTYGYHGKVRVFPLIIGYAGMVLSTPDILSLTDTAIGRAITRVCGAALEKDLIAARPVHRELIVFAGLGGAVLGIYLLGFLIASPLFVFLWMLIGGGKSLKHAIYGGIFTLAFIYVLFELVLRYELDREVTVCDGGGAECGADQLLEVGRDVCQV